VREDNFFAVVFWWGFVKMWAQNVVFEWWERGGLLVKRGERVAVLWRLKNRPTF
jgi:hypothetical protein